MEDELREHDRVPSPTKVPHAVMLICLLLQLGVVSKVPLLSASAPGGLWGGPADVAGFYEQVWVQASHGFNAVEAMENRLVIKELRDPLR